eukprot:6183820-Pleurochrysis_carterae.AAC.3
MVVQLPVFWWLVISARPAAPQPIRSSAIACFRVRGSSETLLIAKAHRVPRLQAGLSRRARRASSAAGLRDGRGYAASVRLKCAGRVVARCSCGASVPVALGGRSCAASD